ncbi:nucleotidyltransferase domain-containing protein [Fluviispira multicolorata]|uniref:Nucleotidyltransferase n=1 Tax=Fluviispira multicolorata TaxID=2654512 RepID=A0A833JF87_9BACT|nr:nucleotidyltransferase [Fluviispira multicolorata]KAB8033586.1 nucleotidyltransferase [Fluviispira multicolorata]
MSNNLNEENTLITNRYATDDSFWSENLKKLVEYKVKNIMENRENKLKEWSKPTSDTEIEKCERSLRMVKEAVNSDSNLSKMNLEVYAKGSFYNRTNIPSDSDVDIAIVAKDYFFNKYPENISNENFGFITSPYSYEDFKKQIELILKVKFGQSNVTIGSKSIKIRSNSCRVNADIVPHFAHRKYKDFIYYDEGVALKDSNGGIIYNWPKQDYDKGVFKNNSTNRLYKNFVRILKNIRYEMESIYPSASKNKVPSYLISCLIYNVPDCYFNENDYLSFKIIIEFLIQKFNDPNNLTNWLEVNEIKNLFGYYQKWEINDVHQFLLDVKRFLEELK